jgi:hypothetical protein
VIERHNPTALDGTSWSSNLYKVRECLCKIYKKATEAQRVLGISNRQWSDVGNIINNPEYDLRHTQVTKSAAPVTFEVQDKAYRAARGWVASYLRIKGISAIG